MHKRRPLSIDTSSDVQERPWKQRKERSQLDNACFQHWLKHAPNLASYENLLPVEEIVMAARDVAQLARWPDLLALFIRCGGRLIHLCYPRNPVSGETYYGWHNESLHAVGYRIPNIQRVNGDKQELQDYNRLLPTAIYNDRTSKSVTWRRAHPPSFLRQYGDSELVNDPRIGSHPFSFASTKAVIDQSTHALDCYHIRLCKRSLPMFNALTVHKHILPFLEAAKRFRDDALHLLTDFRILMPVDLLHTIIDYVVPALWHQFFIDRIPFNRFYDPVGTDANSSVVTTLGFPQSMLDIPQRERHGMLGYRSLEQLQTCSATASTTASAAASSSSSANAVGSERFLDGKPIPGHLQPERFLTWPTASAGEPIPSHLQPMHKKPSVPSSPPFSPKSPSYNPDEPGGISDEDDDFKSYSPTSPSYSPNSPSFTPSEEPSYAPSEGQQNAASSSSSVVPSYAPTSPCYSARRRNSAAKPVPFLPAHQDTTACTCCICAFDT